MLEVAQKAGKKIVIKVRGIVERDTKNYEMPLFSQIQLAKVAF